MRNFRVVSAVAVVVMKTVLMIGLDSTPAMAQSAASGSAPACSTIPANMTVDRALRPMVLTAISHAETVQRQCAVIAAAHHVRVAIRLHPGRLPGGTRARATITHYEYGAIWAEIVLPVTARQIEMLAHELEHVIEQIDGTKLHELAGKSRSGVSRFADGAFETVRAERAGRAAVREVEGTAGTTGTAGPMSAVLSLKK